MTEDWESRALCAQIGGDLWFPERREEAAEAIAICNQCPVRTACLQFALNNDITHGIYGGLTKTERRRLPQPERPNRDAEIARLHADGWTVADLADRYSLSERGIHRVVKKVRDAA